MASFAVDLCPIFIFMYIFTVLLLAIGLSLSSTLVMKGVAFSIGALDAPSEKRKMHEKIIPRGAGLSIFFSFCLSFLFSLFLRGRSLSSLSGALLSGGALIVGIGLCDDVFSLGAKTKLFSQIAISFIPISFGIRIQALSVGRFVFTLPALLSLIFSFLFILSLTNAFNLIDGLDGLSSGVALISIACLFLSGEGEDFSFLCVALFGAILGFLPYNKHKASIFMGDSGSLFLGYSISILSICIENTRTLQGAFVLPVLPIFLVLLYPVCDLAFAVIRRLKNRQSIFAADGRHIHHRLLTLGLSHSETVRLLLLLSAIFASLGTLLLL